MKRFGLQLGSLGGVRVAALAAATLAFAGTAAALVNNVAGAAISIGTPATVEPSDDLNSSIRVFDERQNVRLATDVVVQMVPGQLADDVADVTPVEIPEGTCVSSHYLHYEPGDPAQRAVGRFRLDEAVLGVILDEAELQATDYLGRAATDYPTSLDCNGFCGIDLDIGDRVEVNVDSVRVDLTASFPGDRLRVLTEGVCP